MYKDKFGRKVKNFSKFKGRYLFQNRLKTIENFMDFLIYLSFSSGLNSMALKLMSWSSTHDLSAFASIFIATLTSSAKVDNYYKHSLR